MNKDLLIEYAELKKQEKEISAKIDEFKPKVMEMLLEVGIDEEHPVELADVGTFSLGKRRKYVYSDRVQSLEKTIKEEKEREERTGEAQYNETTYTIFKEIE